MALNSSKQRAESFSSAEQTLLMETYEEYKDVIMTKGNTVAIIRAREAAWQRIADRLNASNLSSQKRTWQQVKIKHKNILSSATRKQTQQRASGEGPLPEELTPAETLALSLNRGSRIDHFHSGSSSNPVDPDFRAPFIDERGDEVILLDPSQPQEEPDDPAGTQDDRGEDHQDREEEEEEEEALSVSDCLLQDVEAGGDGRAMTFSDFQMMRKIERAHFFSSKEQGLILKLYEEERDILTAKSNTTTASKQREEAWQRIADQINVVSDSGYKRTWQQVKVKYKNIVQTAKRKQIEMMRCEAELGPPSLTSADDNMLHHRDALRQDFFPGVHCIDQLSGHDNAFVNVAGHPVLLLPPVTKTEPESLSSEDTDMSESHIDGDLRNHNNFQESCNSAGAAAAGCGAERQTDDVRTLYCCYLKKEMENRDQEMAYRALKMRKLEKEILLLDKQLM